REQFREVEEDSGGRRQDAGFTGLDGTVGLDHDQDAAVRCAIDGNRPEPGRRMLVLRRDHRRRTENGRDKEGELHWVDTANVIAVPATLPVDHAHWKLKPPNRPSTSRISPTRNSPGHRRDAIDAGSISVRSTPPAVTSA